MKIYYRYMISSDQLLNDMLSIGSINKKILHRLKGWVQEQNKHTMRKLNQKYLLLTKYV